MANVNIEKLIKWPALIVGAAIAINLIMGAFGFSIQSNDVKISQELTTHITTTEPKIDTLAIEQKAVNEAIKSLSDGVDAALTGECLENTFEALVRQRLVQKCKELGVDRERYRTPNAAQAAPVAPLPIDSATPQ